MSDTLPPNPADRRFEDYTVGAVYELGTFSLSRAEIIEFASRYDPQTMHIDPAWAAQGPFGALIASGWHTTAAMMRLFVQHYLPHGGLVSPGIDELRWLLPVYAGEQLSVRATVLAARRSRSRPDRGLVTCHVEGVNQGGDPVLSMKPMNFIRCRAESLAPEG